MATTTNLTRVFILGGRNLPDPGSQLTTTDVLEHYAQMHPKLMGGKVVETETTETEIHYELRARVGEHG